MVKFGEDLERAIFPIWRSYYLDYAKLKKVLDVVRETYPYLELLEKHNVIVINDPLRPFELIINGAIFSFAGSDGSSQRNCRLRVTMHDGTAAARRDKALLEAAMAGTALKEDAASHAVSNVPKIAPSANPPEGFSLFIELDEVRAGLLAQESSSRNSSVSVDFGGKAPVNQYLKPHSKGYAHRMREKFIKDLASLKIGKELADSVGGVVMLMFLDGSSAAKAKNGGGVIPKLEPIPQAIDEPSSPAGIAGKMKDLTKDLTTLVGGVSSEQREEIRIKREEAKAVPKQFKMLGAALHNRPTTMTVFLPSSVTPIYSNPSIAHALYCFHLEVSNVIAQVLKEEVEKVSNFYISQSHVICGTALMCADAVKIWRDLNAKERSQIRIAFRQTYSTLDMMQQFCDMNCLAIAKILKKIDKRTHQQMLIDYKHSIDNLIFKMGHDSRIHRLQKILNATFSRHVLKSDSKQGLSYLDSRDTVSGRITEISLAVLVGIVGTMAVVLFGNLHAMGLFDPDTHVFPPGSRAAKYSVTLIFIPWILAYWSMLFAMCVMVWEQFGINFAFMFELDPIFHYTGTELMRDSLVYVLAWMLCVYKFLLVNSVESLCAVTWQIYEPTVALTSTTTPAAIAPPPMLENVTSTAFRIFNGVAESATSMLSGTSGLSATAAVASTTIDTYATTFTSPTSASHSGTHVDNTSLAPLYWVFPIWIVIFVCKAIFNNLYFNNRKSWIGITVWRSLTVPAYQVKFSEFIICNNLASIGGWFFEMTFYLCPLIDGSEGICQELRSKGFCGLSILPAFLRLLQCARRYSDQPKATRQPFPNLINGGKYVVDCMAIFGWNYYYTVKYNNNVERHELDLLFAWVVGIQIFAQVYKYMWDIVVDAGIWIRHDDGVWRLREERVYGVWWPYVTWCLLNIPMGNMWALKLAIAPYTKNLPWMWVVWTSIEITRRNYWNLMRVENEHVNNTEGYRATRFAPIPAKRIVAWDAMSEDLTERFLRSNDKDKSSEEFPAIKGVNMTGITKFFANLPEAEQVKILRGLNPKTKDAAGNAAIATAVGGVAGGTVDGHVFNDTATTTAITTVGSDGRQYATHLPHEGAAPLPAASAVGAAENNPSAILENPPIPSVIFSANNPAAVAAAAVTADLHNASFVDKAKFFSELQEEIKVALVLEFLGLDETMNEYLKRVTGVEVVGAVTPQKSRNMDKKKRGVGALLGRGKHKGGGDAPASAPPAVAVAGSGVAQNVPSGQSPANSQQQGEGGDSSDAEECGGYADDVSDDGNDNDAAGGAVGGNAIATAGSPTTVATVAAKPEDPREGGRESLNREISDGGDTDTDSGREGANKDSSKQRGPINRPPRRRRAATTMAPHTHTDDDDSDDDEHPHQHPIHHRHHPHHQKVLRKIPSMTPGAMFAMAYSRHDDTPTSPLPTATATLRPAAALASTLPAAASTAIVHIEEEGRDQRVGAAMATVSSPTSTTPLPSVSSAAPLLTMGVEEMRSLSRVRPGEEDDEPLQEIHSTRNVAT